MSRIEDGICKSLVRGQALLSGDRIKRQLEVGPSLINLSSDISISQFNQLLHFFPLEINKDEGRRYHTKRSLRTAWRVTLPLGLGLAPDLWRGCI